MNTFQSDYSSIDNYKYIGNKFSKNDIPQAHLLKDKSEYYWRKVFN